MENWEQYRNNGKMGKIGNSVNKNGQEKKTMKKTQNNEIAWNVKK